MQGISTDEQVKMLNMQLADARDNVTNDLQRNVYKNYTDFVVIGKEISKLESDMLVFRGLLQELVDVSDGFRKILPQDMKEKLIFEKEQDAVVITEKQANDLKILYQNMDGLQKLLPESHSRFIVRDGTSSRYSEVNPSTFKEKESCFIYVLNDALVVASWKKNMMTGKNRLVVDRVFALNEVAFIDMKNSPDITNAFKIIKHPEDILYRSETLEEKQSLLKCIQAQTDAILARKKRDKQKSMAPSPVAVKTAPIVEKSLKKVVRDDLSTGDVRWLIELPDELDVLIAHRDFDHAVKLVSKARRILSNCHGETTRVQVLRSSINERIMKLSNLVAADLSSPVATKDQVRGDINKLLRLGLGDQARDIFLSARSKTIRSRLRKIKFDGDLVSYISQFSQLVFRLIRNTCDWYSGSFVDPSMASGFMKWLQDEIKHFTETIRRQVFTTKQDFATIAKCLLTTLDHIQELRDVGLDLSFLMDQIIHDDIKAAIQVYSLECRDTVKQQIESDKFAIVQGEVEVFSDLELKRVPGLSASCHTLYSVLMSFGADVGILLRLTLYNKVVDSLILFFKTYINGLVAWLDKDMNPSQRLVLLTNSHFVINMVFPKVQQQLKVAQLTQQSFEREIPELSEEADKHKTTLLKIENKVIGHLLKHALDVYSLKNVDYSSTAQILDSATPTEQMGKLVVVLNLVVAGFDPILPKQLLRTLMNKIIQTLATQMDEKKKFGYCGVQMFTLDLQFFLACCDAYIDEKATESANQLVGNILKLYFLQNKDISTPLKSGEWYEKRVTEAVSKYKKNLSALLARQAA